MQCLFCTFQGSPAFYLLIRVLPFHPRFTLSSVFYPLIRVLPSHPRFTFIAVFYPVVRPCFTLSSVPHFTLTHLVRHIQKPSILSREGGSTLRILCADYPM